MGGSGRAGLNADDPGLNRAAGVNFGLPDACRGRTVQKVVANARYRTIGTVLGTDTAGGDAMLRKGDDGDGDRTGE